MKGYVREYPLFSLCGLNCGLCPNYHSGGASRCVGCAAEETFFHASCAILACAARHGNIAYCYLCEEYPCKRYENADAADSFISHQNQFKDMEKAKAIGLNAYQFELNEKVEMLQTLLQNYNDGRRKSFFCTAVNLLELQDVRDVMVQIAAAANQADALAIKEKAAIAVNLFQKMAEKREISLKLRKKPKA